MMEGMVYLRTEAAIISATTMAALLMMAGEKKKRTTKYAPSKQANKSKIKVSPKKFCILRGIFNTQYSNLKAGDTRTINDGKYIYIATADGSGSITINDKFAIQTKKRSSNHE